MLGICLVFPSGILFFKVCLIGDVSPRFLSLVSILRCLTQCDHLTGLSVILAFQESLSLI